MSYTEEGQTVLALETSCDESAAAVVRRVSGRFFLLSSCISSQVEEHSQWGGVVPEIASRRHLEAMPFLVHDALIQSQCKVEELDAIASTVAPGLAGALMVGSITGRTLAALHQLPFLGIHHLEGHLSSVFLDEFSPSPPYLVLLVSGGHTEIIYVEREMSFRKLGRSHDDAAGEAFDKVARLLGLSYPGGPAIEAKAKDGDPLRFQFPKGRVSNPSGGFYPYDFSFSGLKTSVLRKVESFKNKNIPVPVEDISASFENAVAEVLVERSLNCAVDHDIKDLVMVGGVAANQRLRNLMRSKASKHRLPIQVHLAPKAFCTDNAAMIGAAALIRLESNISPSSLELGVSPRLSLTEADKLYRTPPPF